MQSRYKDATGAQCFLVQRDCKRHRNNNSIKVRELLFHSEILRCSIVSLVSSLAEDSTTLLFLLYAASRPCMHAVQNDATNDFAIVHEVATSFRPRSSGICIEV